MDVLADYDTVTRGTLGYRLQLRVVSTPCFQVSKRRGSFRLVSDSAYAGPIPIRLPRTIRTTVSGARRLCAKVEETRPPRKLSRAKEFRLNGSSMQRSHSFVTRQAELTLCLPIHSSTRFLRCSDVLLRRTSSQWLAYWPVARRLMSLEPEHWELQVRWNYQRYGRGTNIRIAPFRIIKCQ